MSGLELTDAQIFACVDAVIPNIQEKIKAADAKGNEKESSYLKGTISFCADVIGKARKYRSSLSYNQKTALLKVVTKFATKEQLQRMGLEQPPEQQESRVSPSEKIKALNEIIALEEAKISQLLIQREGLGEEEWDDEGGFNPPEYHGEEWQRLNRRIESLKGSVDIAKRELAKLYSPNEKDLDRKIKQALKAITPYLYADGFELHSFIKEGEDWAKSKNLDWMQLGFGNNSWGRNQAISFVSDYREQLPSELLSELQPLLPSQAERDPFFVRFSLPYIVYMLRVLRHLENTGVVGFIGQDKDLVAFKETGGLGHAPKKVKYRDKYGKWVEGFRKNRKEAAIWKNLIQRIQQRLEKAEKAGKLQNLGNYITSPDVLTRLVDEQGKSIPEIFDSLVKVVQYTPEQRRVAHECMKYLASVCDYAFEEDFQGFSKPDAVLGHKMAAMPEFTNEIMPAALFYCNKYRRQLPDEALEILELKSSNKKRREEQKKQEEPVYTAEKSEEPVYISEETIENNISRYLSVCLLGVR